MGQTRVLIIDRHPTFTDGLAARLGQEADFTVAGTARTTADAGRILDAVRPDLLTVDVEQDDRTISFMTAVRNQHPTLVMVVITGSVDPAQVLQSVTVGGAGWLLKDSSSEELLHTLRGVMRGECWIPPQLLAPVLHDLLQTQRQHSEAQIRLGTLTPREVEVLRLLAQGFNRPAIAARLLVSPHTVRTHTQNVFAKLGVHSGLEAAAVALTVGLRLTDEPVVTMGDSA